MESVGIMTFSEDVLIDFSDKKTGTLYILGKRGDWSRFTSATDEFFISALQDIADHHQWSQQRRDAFLGRLQNLDLSRFDGLNARSGKIYPRLKILRALRVLKEASGFLGSLHTQESYEKFLKTFR